MGERVLRLRVCAMIAAGVMMIAGSPLTQAASLVVSNHGTDSGSCGSSAHPCRSISQAIENAASGDTIWVGAGHYGDLSGDGLFDAPGSEHATMLDPPESFDYTACAVCILKPVQIYSYSGAAVTTIQVGPNAITPTTVLITTNRAVFGSQDHGFTITGGNTNGLVVDLERGNGPMVYAVGVSGNVDLKDGTGFVLDGPQFSPSEPGHCPPPNLVCPPEKGSVTFSWNQAIGSGTGFVAFPNEAEQMLVFLEHNLTIEAGTGFYVWPGVIRQGCDDCFDGGRAPTVTTSENVAMDGAWGFNMNSSGPIVGNVAVNNSQAGFLIEDVPSFQQNAAIGNAGPGVIVGFYIQSGNSGPPLTYTGIGQNNFYGNDRNRPSIVIGSFFAAASGVGPSAHCGVLNVGAVGWNNRYVTIGPSQPPEFVGAENNYWGSPQGPQSSGSGDTAGGACDEFNGYSVAKPFLTTEHGMPTLP
jgi:hypothetical protein